MYDGASKIAALY